MKSADTHPHPFGRGENTNISENQTGEWVSFKFGSWGPTVVFWAFPQNISFTELKKSPSLDFEWLVCFAQYGI